MFQTKRALFHFMALFYLMISVKKDKVGRIKSPNNPARFQLPVAFWLLLFFPVTHTGSWGYLDRDFQLLCTETATQGLVLTGGVPRLFLALVVGDQGSQMPNNNGFSTWQQNFKMK